MTDDITENDGEIARILAEEYLFESASYHPDSSTSSKSYFQASSKHSFVKNAQNTQHAIPSTSKENQSDIYDVDSEIAYILQIEEIALSENNINEKSLNYSNAQLEKTHADMTKHLQTTDESNFMTRVFGMFGVIQTRYKECQGKNQTVIEKIQRLSVQLLPIVASTRNGKGVVSKSLAPIFAISLVTNFVQGNLSFNDVKDILVNLLQTWNESSVWYEFFEQLVYISIAVTVPLLAERAMGKVMDKILSTKALSIQ